MFGLSNNQKPFPCWMKVLFLILTITSLLVSCRLPWAKPEETATEEEAPEAKVVAPEVTPEPREDLPPALVEVSPISGSAIDLNQPISFYFNQPMDTGSVEAAFHFEPRVSGRFTWQDQQILTFTPDQNYIPDTHLALVINTSAQAENNKSLQAPIAIDYQTADELLVAQLMPSDLALDVDPESAVFVTFNQPVVPLGGEEDGPPAFSLNPQVSGEGKWLNTTTYIFKPEVSMAGGTMYTIQLNDALTATSGAEFESQELQFLFTTTTPKVLAVLPLESDLLSLDGPVEVRFNIRMDPESVENNFSMTTPNGSNVHGSFDWGEDFESFRFTPTINFQRNVRYIIQVDQGARSYGGLPITETFTTFRRTYPDLNVDPAVLPDFRNYYGQYGQYEIAFTTPLAKESFRDHVRIEPEVVSEGYYLGNEDQNIFLNGYFRPEMEYTLTLEASLEDVWGGRLGRDLTYTFVTPSVEPSLRVGSGYTSFNLMFVPADGSEILLQATNINTVTLDIAPISINDLLTLVHPDNYEYRQVFLPDNLETTTENLDLTRNVNQTVILPLTYQGEPLRPGVYFLGVTSADLLGDGTQTYQKYTLVVSQNNVVMKIAPEQAFVWASRLVDYSPVGRAPVSVYNTEGDLLTEGETNSSGLFIQEIERFDGPYTNFLAVIGEPGQDDFAFSISTWDQGYALYEQGIIENTLPELTQAYIYTDRPIYRPGDTVHFKAVLFSRENGIPVPPGFEQVEVAVFGDPGMSGVPVNLYSETETLSAYNTVDGSANIPPDASPGSFRIELRLDEKLIESLYFDVANYRKPEIEMTLDLAPVEIISGEDLNAQFQADYYFGIPVVNQPFNWTLNRDDFVFHLPGYEVGPLDTTWLMPRVSEFYSFGKTVARGEGRTGSQGDASLRFTEEDMALGETPKGSLQELNLQVTITDESSFPVSYRETALVHPESFYIGIKPESYFGNANTPFSFTVKTVDWDKEARGEIALEATFEAIEWEVEETGSMEMPYRYIPQKTLIDTANPVTGADGLTRIQFTPPEPGTYQLSVESGNALSQALVWVAGEGSPAWPRRTQNLIELTVDAENYEVGQSAQVFFPNPFVGAAKALITIERGRVMETPLVDVEGSGYSMQVPITEESIPNIYISVMLFGKNEAGQPDYRQGVHNIAVVPSIKTLNVELVLDPTETEPGEMVEGTLLITDWQGNPVQGEFSVAVVDKALLALAEENSPPILEALYRKQPLSVQTSFSLKTFATQLALTAELGIGGGGGDMDAARTLREEFPDTALWEGKVVTGSDGTALIEIPLPDSLTTWVVDVRGLTEDYRVGQAEGEIVTQKPLMLRPVTPRFLVDGDRVELAAVVHNNTQESLSIEVSMLGTGFSLDDGSDQTQIVTLRAGKSIRVTWWGVVESRETVELVFQALSGAYADATKPVWGDLDVLRYAMPRTFSTAGYLEEEGRVLELVSLPLSMDPSSGTLNLELQPSLTAAMVDRLEALETLPYIDTISILSRFLANVTTFRTLQALEVESSQLEGELSDLVGSALHDILDLQKYDGGWPWWGGFDDEYQPSDPFISAYVLFGLQEAVNAGFFVDDYYLDRAVEYLSKQLEKPENIEATWELDRLAFQIYVLRDSDLYLGSYTDALYERRTDLSPWALGLLTLALDQLEGINSRQTLLGDLEAGAIRSETGVHWESEDSSWMLPGTPLFNTAVGVLTLAELDPASTSLLPALRYLMIHQKGNMPRSSTFESAWTLMAITAALEGTGDYQADYSFQAILNDRLVAEGDAGGTIIPTPINSTTSILDLYPESPNALVIERSAGTGTLYYRLDLEAYQPAADAEPINKGISLQREYYLAGEGCPGGDECEPMDSLALDPDDPTQMVTAALTLTLSNDMYKLMLEDFIPAGTEILNKKFLTSQTVQEELIDTYDPRDPFRQGWGWWYFNQPQIYDDHILWTADFVPAGTYVLTYELIPYQRGDFQVLPAHAWMYFYPEVQGTSAGSLFTIE